MQWFLIAFYNLMSLNFYFFAFNTDFPILGQESVPKHQVAQLKPLGVGGWLEISWKSIDALGVIFD